MSHCNLVNLLSILFDTIAVLCELRSTILSASNKNNMSHNRTMTQPILSNKEMMQYHIPYGTKDRSLFHIDWTLYKQYSEVGAEIAALLSPSILIAAKWVVVDVVARLH